MLSHHDFPQLLLITLAGLYAGTQNTLAGGGSFITFPTLLLAGLNPLSANITSTIALPPNQITSCLAGRKLAGGIGETSLGKLFGLSLAGGLFGALLLLNTPVTFFARLVPWLVLFATAIFTWGRFRKKPLHGVPRERPHGLKSLSRRSRRPERPFGGNLCPECSREKIKGRLR